MKTALLSISIFATVLGTVAITMIAFALRYNIPVGQVLPT